jgi:DNA polymerase elongation subunit (family B)
VLDNLRAVTGVSYSDPIGGNIDMMDTLFLRKAAERGLALPTATKPEVGYYHGAYVYTPEPGLHDNIVYPDFSSLYPNIMYQCNISPETLIGGEDEFEASDYTEDDVVWTWYDPHTPPHIKEDEEADESKMEKLYFVKPSIKEGFIRSVLDDIMGLADEYTGGLYEAVKRVRNSSYGVLGDSDSYGRGFRLFDWRLAEGTTLGGQKMLKKGAEMFAERIDDEDARVIYGDTDSVVTTVPNAESDEDALSKAISAADDVSADLNEYAKEIFGLESVEDARMDLEIESYASSIFFKAQDDGRSTDGVKKRYVQNVVWDDDDMWKDEPELIIKGFEYVRSDVSAITKDVQKKAFEALMENSADEARDIVVKYTKQKVVELMEGDMDANEFGIPFGISQALTKYGARDRRPQPQYRGAKYANQEIYGGSAIGPGDKPLYFYIQDGKVANGMRKTYGAETAEDGQYVDAISVLDAEDLPKGVMIDRRKMVQKTIIRPMEAIFHTLGWDIEQLERAADRATPPEHHRDEGQTGFEAYEAM